MILPVGAHDENALLKAHTWDEYCEWHLALDEEATDQTKKSCTRSYAVTFAGFIEPAS